MLQNAGTGRPSGHIRAEIKTEKDTRQGQKASYCVELQSTGQVGGCQDCGRRNAPPCLVQQTQGEVNVEAENLRCCFSAHSLSRAGSSRAILGGSAVRSGSPAVRCTCRGDGNPWGRPQLVLPSELGGCWRVRPCGQAWCSGLRDEGPLPRPSTRLGKALSQVHLATDC